MVLPPGFTEEEVVKIIDSIVNQLASQFRFGYHQPEDLRQEGRLMALEVLEKKKFNINWGKEDGSTSNQKLFRFLYTHVRYRLINFKRDKYQRLETPCKVCPFFDPDCKKSVNQCGTFLDKMECDKWALWVNRQTAKKNLNEMIDIHDINPNNEKNTEYNVDMNDIALKKDLMKTIDRELPAMYRANYSRLLQGARIPKAQLEELKAVLKPIIEKFGEI